MVNKTGKKCKSAYQQAAENVAKARDRGDHFKVVGLKTLANIKKHSGRCFAIYLAFARHLIYHLNKYNINVHTCYTVQYSQYVK